MGPDLLKNLLGQKTRTTVRMTAAAFALVVAMQNCSQTNFAGGGATAGGSASPQSVPGCTTNSFGQVCSGSSAPTDANTQAHAFLYSYGSQSNGINPNMLSSTTLIPDLAFYTTEVNVPDQDYSIGFPGYPKLTDWFGVCYDASFTASTTGSYTFVTAVDDTIVVWIDGKMVVDDNGHTLYSGTSPITNDGSNFSYTPEASPAVALTAGTHSVMIQYLQGWPTFLGEQLWVYPPGSNYPGGTPDNSHLMPLGGPVNGKLLCPH